MADENKNQDPEEENKGASNDDDFGLPDFEFEALDDDDDDDAEENVESDSAPELSKEEEPSADSDDELPSIDDGDLEDLDLDLDDVDLEGIEDVDLDDLDDLGDLDLDDLDLEDLDKDLEDLDKTIEETEVPQPASAERIEDVFDSPRPETNEDVEPIEDDGEFYEEESFGDFDDADFSEDSDLVGDVQDTSDANSDEGISTDADGIEDQLEDIGEPGELPSGDYSDDFDSSIFDDDTEGLDLGSGADEPVPFAKRDLPPEYQSSSEDEVDEISQAEIGESKGKFVRIVVLGTVLFLAIGFGFLYWYSDGNLGQYFGGEPSEEVAESTEKSKPVAKKTEQPVSKKETSQRAETKKEDESSTSEVKKASSTPKTEQPKTQQPKKQEPKKTTTTKPASTNSGNVATLGSTTGQRHIIVGSFLDEASAQAFAGKLAKQGEAPSVIPPFNGAPNYRVSVASYASFSEANSNLESFRERFSGAWILRY